MELNIFYNYKNLKINVDEKIFDLLYKWKSNDGDALYATVNYRRIIDFLILFNLFYNKKKCLIEFNDEYKNNIIPQYISACEKKIGYRLCVEEEIKTILLLFKNINKTPLFRQVYSKTLKSKFMTLYRGFQYDRYSGFFHILDHDNLKINSIITTPTFLSTTVIKYTALFFIRSSLYEVQGVDINKTIMWKIKIPNDKLMDFPYTYLGKNVNLNKLKKFNNPNFNDETFINKFINDYECEFLLNIGASLKLTSIKYKSINDKLFGKLNFKLLTFEFLGYDKIYQNMFLKNMKEFKKCLYVNTPHVKPLYYCKNPKRLLNCTVI